MNRIGIFVAVASLLVGCNNSSHSSGASPSSSSPSTSSVTTATAAVRVLHASPDAPGVDVYVDGSAAVTSLGYTQGTGYLNVPAGVTAVEVDATGTRTAVIQASPTLVAGDAYTIIAVNSLSLIQPLVLTDDRSTPPAGMARVRIVHASPNAGPVDIYVTAPTDPLATPTLADVTFQQAAAALLVPAGDYRARITPTGQTAVAFDSGTITLADGENITLVAVDAPSGVSPVALVVLSETPSSLITDARARIRAVHASPDAPAVDILADGQVAVPGVTYEEASGYLYVSAGSHTISVNPAGTATSVLSATLTIPADQSVTVLAANFLSMITPIVLTDDSTPPAPGNVKVRLVHASPSAGNVDVYVTAPGADLSTLQPTVAGFEFGNNTGYLEVPAGAYEVRITLAGTLTVAIDTGTLTLAAGQNRTAIAVDPAPGTTAFAALLLADRD